MTTKAPCSDAFTDQKPRLNLSPRAVHTQLRELGGCAVGCPYSEVRRSRGPRRLWTCWAPQAGSPLEESSDPVAVIVAGCTDRDPTGHAISKNQARGAQRSDG